MTPTITSHQTQIEAEEPQEESICESQDEAQDISQDESQDEAEEKVQDNESQIESQEESQDESQDESQIDEDVETLAEGSLMTMTAQADNNKTKNEMENGKKQGYVPPEERCRQAAEREKDEDDTRRLSLSNFPPLSNSSERNRMINKRRNKRVTSPGSAGGNVKTKAAKAGGSPNKWKP